MREVKLNRKNKRIHNNLNLVALVDEEDFEKVNQYYWQVKIHGATYYAKRRIVVDGKQTSESMHRFILGLSDPLVKTDHRGNNGLNNQKRNLRICSQQFNSRNRNKSRFDKRNKLSSAYKGVSLNYKKFAARIRVNGNLIALGLFSDEMDAAKAYNNAAVKYFGEFANLNSLPEHQKIKL